jgi:large subunit ribosomal protein L18
MITRYQRRKFRVRNAVIQNNKSERPRIVVSRSNQNMYAQLINVEGKILASYSTLNFTEDKKISGIEKAKVVGKEFAKICLQNGISQVVFDKGAYAYSGRVKTIAESCREAGLQF